MYLFKSKYRNYFDYIIIDEAHRSAADLHKNIIHFFNPKFLLGMTATPERTDGKDIYSFFDNNIAMDIRLNKSLDKKLISPFNYFAIDSNVIDNNNKIRIHKNNSHDVAKNILDEIKQKGFYGVKLKALIFVYNIEEANLLAKAFTDFGIDAEAVHSKNSKNNYENQIELIKEIQDDNKTLEILITINKFNEGVDIPKINTIIMARYTESSIIFLQQLGRGLRKLNGQNKFLTVLDFVGNYNSSFEIVKAISGIETNDRSRLMAEIENDFPSSSKHINITLSYKSKVQIMSSIKRIKRSRKTSITNTIVEQYKYLGKIPTLIQIEEKKLIKVEDLLQINGSLLEALNFKNDFFSQDEKDYIKYIQRFPIVTTSIKEKIEIIDLLKNGIHQFNNEKWSNYFIGETITYINKGQKNHFKNLFYKEENNQVVANDIPKTKLIEKMINITIEYLQYQVDHNISNYMQMKSKYKREEILFMFGRKDLTSNRRGNVFHNNDLILFNHTEKNNLYNNKVLGLNKVILSTQNNTEIDLKNQILNYEVKVYNFIQNSNFMQNDGSRYIYLGTEYNVNLNEYKKHDNRYLFEYSLPYSISKEEFEELNW